MKSSAPAPIALSIARRVGSALQAMSGTPGKRRRASTRMARSTGAAMMTALNPSSAEAATCLRRGRFTQSAPTLAASASARSPACAVKPANANRLDPDTMVPLPQDRQGKSHSPASFHERLSPESGD
jgi:hypothetical protein